jgi:hypothetical protein
MFGIAGLLLGIVFVLVGLFMAFFFPTATIHQTEGFGLAGVIIGFIVLILGGILVFLP